MHLWKEGVYVGSAKRLFEAFELVSDTNRIAEIIRVPRIVWFSEEPKSQAGGSWLEVNNKISREVEVEHGDIKFRIFFGLSPVVQIDRT